MRYVLKSPITISRAYAADPTPITIEAGARLNRDRHGAFWVAASTFPRDSILYHDATYYGFPVPPSEVTYIPTEERDYVALERTHS